MKELHIVLASPSNDNLANEVDHNINDPYSFTNMDI